MRKGVSESVRCYSDTECSKIWLKEVKQLVYDVVKSREREQCDKKMTLICYRMKCCQSSSRPGVGMKFKGKVFNMKLAVSSK